MRNELPDVNSRGDICRGSAPDHRPGGASASRRRTEQPVLAVFAHAGGIAASYRRLLGWLEGGTRLLPVERPGAGARRAAAACRTVPELVADQVTQLRTGLAALALDGPVALTCYGHSLGALVAAGVAQALAADGAPVRCTRLVVSGRNAPWLPSGIPPLSVLPDERLVDALVQLGGRDTVALRDAGLASLLLPHVRTELRLAEDWPREPVHPRLDCPVVVLDADGDLATTDAGVRAWQDVTTASTCHHQVAGDHFFVERDGGRPLSAVLAAHHRAVRCRSASGSRT